MDRAGYGKRRYKKTKNETTRIQTQLHQIPPKTKIPVKLFSNFCALGELSHSKQIERALGDQVRRN